MDDKSKLAWLNVCIEDGTNPYGERPQLSNFDGHWSNETIEYSARMEEAKVTGLETPGHHTAALQQMDQRGGPCSVAALCPCWVSGERRGHADHRNVGRCLAHTCCLHFRDDESRLARG